MHLDKRRLSKNHLDSDKDNVYTNYLRKDKIEVKYYLDKTIQDNNCK